MIGTLIGGALFTAGTAAAATAALVINGALIGAAIGGLSAAVTGGNIGKGILFGAIGGAVSGGFAAYSQMGSGMLSTAAGSAGGTGGGALGGNVASYGTQTVIKSGGKDVIIQQTLSEGTKQASTSTFLQQVGTKVVEKGAEYMLSQQGAEGRADWEKEKFYAGLESNERIASIRGGGGGGGGGPTRDYAAELAFQREKWQEEVRLGEELRHTRQQAFADLGRGRKKPKAALAVARPVVASEGTASEEKPAEGIPEAGIVEAPQSALAQAEIKPITEEEGVA